MNAAMKATRDTVLAFLCIAAIAGGLLGLSWLAVHYTLLAMGLIFGGCVAVVWYGSYNCYRRRP